MARPSTPRLRQFDLSQADSSDEEDAIFIVGVGEEEPVGRRVAVTHEGRVFLAEVTHCETVRDPYGGGWSGLYEVEVSYLIP